MCFYRTVEGQHNTWLKNMKGEVEMVGTRTRFRSQNKTSKTFLFFEAKNTSRLEPVENCAKRIINK